MDGVAWPTFRELRVADITGHLCPFSGRRELARFDEDFGEAVREAVEVKARSTV
jgi:hypothetical protein